MDRAKQRQQARAKRRGHVRKKVKGTNERPRLCVYRSLQYTYAQLISDVSGAVLTTASSRNLDGTEASPGSVEGAKQVGKKIAELAKEKDISEVVFDRNGYLYHGRVAAVAEGARESGMKI